MKLIRVVFLCLCYLIISISSALAESNCSANVSATFSCDSVSVTSSKDISHIILEFCDGSLKKFDNLNGYTKNFTVEGGIKGVYVKSGCTYEYLLNPYGCSCIEDCLGIPNGSAVVDDCGVCDGHNLAKDDCGVCFGDGSSCIMDICYAPFNSQGFPEKARVINIKDYNRDYYMSTGLVGDVNSCNLITICSNTDNGQETIEIAAILFPYYEANYNAKKGDCVFEPLKSRACAEVNGFLNQANIASVINRTEYSLKVTVTYTDLLGVEKDSVSATLGSYVKRDFIVDEMGLEDASYGTVCVNVETDKDGAWYGGITTYKPNETGEGDFDFALYYPFTNTKKGVQYSPLNTYRLGASLVANWIRITDAVRDGKGLTGKLEYFNAYGIKVNEDKVVIPDAGRFDFAGHTGLGGPLSNNAVGFAKFTPENKTSEFYFTTSRYFYYCHETPVGESLCNNFLGGFVTPNRTPINGVTFGNITTKDSTMTVIELNNTSEVGAVVKVSLYDSLGNNRKEDLVKVPKTGTTHYIVNNYLNDEVGYAKVNTNEFSVAVSTYVYNLDSSFNLNYGFSTPFTSSPGSSQVFEFNSFLGQTNTIELHNTTDYHKDVVISVIDYSGSLIDIITVSLDSKESFRKDLDIELNTYGTLVVLSGDGVILRNFVKKSNEYVLPFIGK